MNWFVCLRVQTYELNTSNFLCDETLNIDDAEINAGRFESCCRFVGKI